jgi:hypothetical protein
MRINFKEIVRDIVKARVVGGSTVLTLPKAVLSKYNIRPGNRVCINVIDTEEHGLVLLVAKEDQ